jgi:hypothetical protein
MLRSAAGVARLSLWPGRPESRSLA